MKFGSSLSEGVVPEWKEQYVDYNYGKTMIKKLKASKFEQYEEPDKFKTSQAATSVNPLEREDSNENIAERRPSTDNRGRSRSIFKFSTRSQKDSLGPGSEVARFVEWLDSEYAKVEAFYEEKEHEVHERFLILQDQLYQLRDHKASILKHKTHKLDDGAYGTVQDFALNTKSMFSSLKGLELPSLPATAFLKKMKTIPNELTLLNNGEEQDYHVNYKENRIRNGLEVVEDNSDIDSDSSSTNSHRRYQPSVQTPSQAKQVKRREYTVKKHHFGVPYAYARRQLKDAVLKHYRALSLLKSYRELNRTAFKKITKKFDKSMKTNISESYMDKVDNHSYFQTSDLPDKLAKYLEELFIAFYDPETTDKKRSLEKLKSIAYAINNNNLRPITHYGTLFTSGVLLGIGLPFFILGLIKALQRTLSGKYSQGKYMLQIWGGFFLIDFTLLLFGINFMIFDYYKINYKFIFEFDITTALDYKQFILIPSIGFCLMSIFAWFSFQEYWPVTFPGKDWPWLYLGIMLIIFLWPGKQLYASARKWIQIALWRILLSGFYPVEFRDFFIGDILCSMTYTMGNIPFFFCLYSREWGTSDKSFSDTTCGSSRSRLVGFFSTLPAIFRLLQSLRRYMDTGDWFPHLANLMKYAFNITYYALLSNYRVETNQKNRAVFIVIACLNSIFSGAWDVVMDWSLFQSGSKHRFLRNNLFFKWPGYYYAAIVADILLRFQWIFYAFFSSQIQQSAVTSFSIAIAEVLRRFIWIFFRMENEHCTNVILFRASKDTPLPYSTSNKVLKAIKKLVDLRYSANNDVNVLQSSRFSNGPSGSGQSSAIGALGRASMHDEESTVGRHAASNISLSRRRSTFNAISDSLQNAHIKDFQRKNKIISSVEESDEEDEDDEDNNA